MMFRCLTYYQTVEDDEMMRNEKRNRGGKP